MILCNFVAPDTHFYDYIIQIHEPVTIFDFSNRVNPQLTKHSVVPRFAITGFSAFHPEALKMYLNFCEQLSRVSFDNGESIRSINIVGMPLYWMTPISEKHPRNHWGLSLFYLLSFLKEVKPNKVSVYLPGQLKTLRETITIFCNPSGIRSSIIIGKENRGEKFDWRIYYTSVARFLFFYLRTWSVNFALEQEDHDFSTSLNLVTGSFNLNSGLTSDFHRLSIEKDKELRLFPDHLSFKNEDETQLIKNRIFCKECPGIIDLVRILVSVFANLIRLRNLESNLKQVGIISFPTKILKDEMIETLRTSFGAVILLNWYTKFFKKYHGIFFIEDEFYASGRTISQAKIISKNNNVILKGVQHGMFSESHTVYRIMAGEVTPVGNEFDKIPIPDRFIVWGKYFKSLLTRDNLFPPGYVSIAGPLKYLNFTGNKSYAVKRPVDRKLLWCLTAQEQFLHETSYIKEMLLIDPTYKLHIRKHPRGLVETTLIQKILKQQDISFQFDSSEASIITSAGNSSLVVTSSHSTIFVDCMALKIPVVRILYDRFDEDLNIKMPFVYVARAVSDIKDVMINIGEADPDSNLIEEFIYGSTDQWDRELQG